MEWSSDGRVWNADFDLVLPAAEAGPAASHRPGRRRRMDGEVLRDADSRLSEGAGGRPPDAGGLVVASRSGTTPGRSPGGWNSSPASNRRS